MNKAYSKLLDSTDALSTAMVQVLPDCGGASAGSLVAHTGDAQCAEEALPPLVALLRLQHSEGVRSPCLCAFCSSGDASPPPVADCCGVML